MGVYTKKQKMVDDVCADIATCVDLIGEKDESKADRYGFVPGIGNMTIQVDAMNEQIHKLREGIFQVLFTGEFNAGKSTLINALMCKDLLRTSIKAETAVITKIVFNADEKVLVHKRQVDANLNPIIEEYTVENFFECYRVDQKHSRKFENVDYVQLQQSQDGIAGSLVQFVDSPGTSNSDTDTDMARAFAKKANAIVYLINAIQPFTFEDKDYIKSHYANRSMRNLFFVINHYDGISPQEQDALKNNARQQLEDVFTVAGRFDEDLYNNRVFYTNAFGSLNTRLGKPTPTYFGDIMLDDNKTGIPEFEEALGKFLTDDGRDKDFVMAYIPQLSAIFAIAKKNVATALKQYADGKDKLEKEKQELEVGIEKIKRILSEIELVCNATAAILTNKFGEDYENYVSAIENGWNEYFSDENVFKDTKFGTIELLSLIKNRKNEEKLKKILAPIHLLIEKYAKSKENVLKENMEQTLNLELIQLENKLRFYQTQFDSLNDSVNIYDGLKNIMVATNSVSGVSPDAKINIFQVLVGIVGMDPEIILGGIGGSQSNADAIFKSILTNFLEIIALNVVAPPFGIAMLVKIAMDKIDDCKEVASDNKKKIVMNMKTGTIEALRIHKREFINTINKTIAGAFVRAGKLLSQKFQAELADTHKSYEEKLKNLEEIDFTIDKETVRSGYLLSEFVKRISHISEVTTGISLTEIEILEKASGPSI